MNSPFLAHDHLMVDIARIYSNEYKKPFHVMIGDFDGYDIASQDGEQRLEVKRETTPIRTNNVAIEYWNTDFDRPSGILGTDANIWLHITYEADGMHAYEYEIAVLRKLSLEQGEVKSNGRNALCKIIPLEIFSENAKRTYLIDACPSAEKGVTHAAK